MALAAEAEAQPQGKIQSAVERAKGMWSRNSDQSGGDKSDEGSETKFRRNLFVNTLNPRTAERAAKKENSSKLKEAAKPSEFVGFSEKTREEFTTFLDGYLQDIADTGRKPGGMDLLKSQPHAAEFFSLIGADKDDFNADSIPEKVTEILAQPEGWIQTKALLEQETALALALAGMASAADGANRQNDPNQLLADRQKNPWRGGNIGRSTQRFLHNHRRALGGVAGAAYGGVLGAVLGESLEGIGEAGGYTAFGDFAVDVVNNTADAVANSPVAAVTAVAVGAYGAWRGAANAGERTGVTPTEERLQVVGQALESLKGPENEALRGYIKSRYKIDVNDFDINPTTGELTLVARDLRRSTGDVRDVMEQAVKNFKTRDAYYEDLGVPKDARDITPEQFLVSGKDPELHSERIHHDIMDKYYALGGDRTRTPENFKKMREAREFVMANLTEQLTVKINGPEGPKDVSTINQKISDRLDGGRFLEDQKDEITKENDALRERQIGMQGRIRDIEKYNATLLEHEKATKELPDFLAETFPHNTSIPEDDALEEIREARRGTSPREFSIDGNIVRIEPIQQRIDQARTDFNNKATQLLQNNQPVANEPYDVYQTRIKNLQQPLIDERDAVIREIREDEQKLKGIEDKIKALQKKIKDTKDKIKPDSQESQDRHVAVFMRNKNERDMARDLVHLLPSVDFRKADPSVILKAINDEYKSSTSPTAPAGTVVNGWDKADNEDIDKQEIVNYMIIIHQAEQNGPASAAAINEFYTNTDFNVVMDIQQGISPEYIELTPESEVVAKLAALGKTKTGGAPVTEADVTNYKDIIAKYVNATTTAIRQVEEDAGKRIARKEREANVIDVHEQVGTLEVTRDIMENQGKIFGKRRQMMSSPSEYFPLEGTRIQVFSDLSDSDQKTYTDSEQKLKSYEEPSVPPTTPPTMTTVETPMAYFKMMDTLFDYKERADANEYFAKISKELPPQLLLELLQEGAEAAGLENLPMITDISDFFMEFQDQLKTNRVTQPALRKVFTTVIDYMQARAMALP